MYFKGFKQITDLAVILLRCERILLHLPLLGIGFSLSAVAVRRLRKRQPWLYAWLDACGCAGPLPLPPPPGLLRQQVSITSLRHHGCAVRSGRTNPTI